MSLRKISAILITRLDYICKVRNISENICRNYHKVFSNKYYHKVFSNKYIFYKDYKTT